MARKTFEMSFQIGGKLASSFSSAFSGATNKLVGLKNQARQTQRALDQLSNDFRKGKIHESQYAESTKRLTNELGKLERAQKRINSFKSGISQGVNTAKSTASVVAFGAAAAATGLAMSSLDKAGNFQQQMTKVGVIAGASQSEMKKLNDTALQLGASSTLSSSEVAVAMTELAAKGMDTNKIVGAMPGILAAAEASGEDLAMTSNVVTSALNAFGLKATEAGHIADVMAMSANKTAAGVEDLGYSFKYAAPVANTLGISLEELAASTGLMVDKGLTGEQAGTSLRMALIRLAKPPKAASKALDKLNLSVTDSHDKFKSLTKLTDDWNKSTKGLSQTQKVAYAADVFGVEAATGMLNLFASGPEKIDAMTKSLENSSGSAKKAAKAMKDNYAGALDQLKGSIESAQIKFATPLLPVFQDLFSGISSTLDKNVGGIEKAGEKVANGLRDIFEPFSTQKPVKPKLKDYGNLMLYDEAMSQYKKDLAKFNKFDNMDFGDKVVYGLDQATAKTSQWLDGSGGESMNKIFTKLGEISAKAWYTAFTNTVKSSLTNLGEGNFGAASALALAAWMMGGGALTKGIFKVGKGMYSKVKDRRGASTAGSRTASRGATSKVVPPVSSGKASASPTGSRASTKAAERAASKPTIFKKILDPLGKTTKVLSKVALPLTAATTIYDVATSNDKTKAAVSGATGMAGGWGGAELGAAIGTAIFPGIGTIVGGLLGGITGYVGGKWVGDKAVDTTRQVMNPVPQPTTAAASTPTAQTAAATQVNTEALKQSMTQLQTAMASTTQNFTILTSYVGQASGWLVGSFVGIQSSADSVKSNLDILVGYVGQASGWLASLSNIPSASQNVQTALNNLATRINNVQVPSSVGAKGNSKRVSYND